MGVSSASHLHSSGCDGVKGPLLILKNPLQCYHHDSRTRQRYFFGPAAAAPISSGRCERSVPGRNRMEECLRHLRLDISAPLTESLFVNNGSQ